MTSRIEHFINEKLSAGKSGNNSTVFNPAKGVKSATVALASAEEVDSAVAAAKAAFPGWSETSPLIRARIFSKNEPINLTEKLR